MSQPDVNQPQPPEPEAPRAPPAAVVTPQPAAGPLAASAEAQMRRLTRRGFFRGGAALAGGILAWKSEGTTATTAQARP